MLKDYSLEIARRSGLVSFGSSQQTINRISSRTPFRRLSVFLTLTLFVLLTSVLSGQNAILAAGSAGNSPFDGKIIVILGDSSTTVNMWPSVFISDYLPPSARVINTARGGATWSQRPSIPSILNQWRNAQKEIGENARPDIVIITVGGNRFPDSKLTYENVIDLCESKDLSAEKGEMETAIIALRTIIADCPEIDLYLVANFYAGPNPAKDRVRRNYRTQLSALCDFFSCNLIDLTRNSNIRGYLEKENSQRIFTNDGVHLSTDKGKARIARLVFAAISANYPPRYQNDKQ